MSKSQKIDVLQVTKNKLTQNLIEKRPIHQQADQKIQGQTKNQQNPQRNGIIFQPKLKKRLNSSKSSQKSDNKSKDNLPFYLSSDRKQSKQHYEKLKALRNQYSHQNTSKVVKQVQLKIKDWMQRQKQIKINKKKLIQKQLQQQKKIMQTQQQCKKRQLQQKKQRHQQQVKQRMLKLKAKKQHRQSRLNLAVAELKIYNKQTTPLYVNLKKQFQQKIKQQQMKVKDFLQQKRASMSLDAKSIKQHEKKYLEEIKQRQAQREQTKLNKNNFQNQLNGKANQFFTFFKKNDSKIKQQQSKKAKIKSFVQSLKTLQTTRKKSKISQKSQSNEKDHSLSEKSTEKKKLKKKALSTRNLTKNIDYLNRNQIGNTYLKQAKKVIQQQKSQPSHVLSLPSIEKKVEYKNYLSELKLQKPIHSDEIEKAKKSLKNPSQILKQFNRRQKAYEQKMIKKIKQFKKLQKSEIYQKALGKEMEIDQIHNKILRMRLACLQIS